MQHFLRHLFRIEALFAVLAYTVVTLALVADIIGREMFHHSIWGIQKVAVYAAVAAGLVGLGLATSKGKHIRPKFTDNWAPAAWTRNLARLGDLIACITFSFAGYFSILLVQDSYNYQFLAPVLDWPIWPFQIILPYTFFSTALRHAAFTLQPKLRPDEELQ
ncbi:MAG TPA: hypothetical protein DE045_00895 [Oceanospirillaceae bacterium]|nr:hypothetical protein [Oceanospirillaceae bacterium]